MSQIFQLVKLKRQNVKKIVHLHFALTKTITLNECWCCSLSPWGLNMQLFVIITAYFAIGCSNVTYVKYCCGAGPRWPTTHCSLRATLFTATPLFCAVWMTNLNISPRDTSLLYLTALTHHDVQTAHRTGPLLKIHMATVSRDLPAWDVCHLWRCRPAYIVLCLPHWHTDSPEAARRIHGRRAGLSAPRRGHSICCS